MPALVTVQNQNLYAPYYTEDILFSKARNNLTIMFRRSFFSLYTFFAKSNSAHVLYCSPFPLVFDPFYDIIYKLVLRLIRGAVGEGVDHDMIIAGLLLQPYH